MIVVLIILRAPRKMDKYKNKRHVKTYWSQWWLSWSISKKATSIFSYFLLSPGTFDNSDVDLVARLLENIKGRRPDVDDERFQLRGAEHFQSLQVGWAVLLRAQQDHNHYYNHHYRDNHHNHHNHYHHLTWKCGVRIGWNPAPISSRIPSVDVPYKFPLNSPCSRNLPLSMSI